MDILWIGSDQQRWDTRGCLGNALVCTPNLDRLASEGLLKALSLSKGSAELLGLSPISQFGRCSERTCKDV